ncbi:MAG: oligosaccharide flippase family protein [Methanobacterium formicicum]
MSFIKNTIITFSTQLFVVLMSFIVSIFLSRTLGPTGLGTYSLVILVSTLLVNIGTLGIGISNTYFTGKDYDIVKITSNSIILSLLLGSLIATSFFILNFIYPDILNNINANLVNIVIVILPLTFLTNFFSSILLGKQKIKEFNFIMFIQYLFLLIFLLTFLLLINGSVFFAILAWSISSVISSITSIILIKNMTEIKLSFDFALFKKSLNFGLKSYISNIIGFLLYRVDMFLVNAFLGITFVGYYSVSVMLVETLWYLPTSVGTVVLSQTLKLSKKESNELTPIICRNTIFLTIILAVILLLFGKQIIIIFFGNSFIPALLPLQILLLGAVAMSINKVLSNELIARGKPIIGAIAASIALSINLPLNLLLIPKFGISGAALSSTISYSISTIIPLFAFIKISDNNIYNVLIINKNDIKIYKTFIKNFLK